MLSLFTEEVFITNIELKVLHIKFLKSLTVGVVLELIHGLVKVEKQTGEEGGPKSSQFIKRSQGVPYTWGEVVIMTSRVPDHSEMILHRAPVIGSPLL